MQIKQPQFSDGAFVHIGDMTDIGMVKAISYENGEYYIETVDENGQEYLRSPEDVKHIAVDVAEDSHGVAVDEVVAHKGKIADEINQDWVRMLVELNSDEVYVNDEYVGRKFHNGAYEFIASAIVRKIKNYSMPPEDVNGVPILVGDIVKLYGHTDSDIHIVQALIFDGCDWYFECAEGTMNCLGFVHVEPDPIVDLLEEMLSTGGCVPKDWVSITQRYAEKIRGVVENGLGLL